MGDGAARSWAKVASVNKKKRRRGGGVGHLFEGRGEAPEREGAWDPAQTRLVGIKG